MKKTYEVIVVGEAREIYEVAADNEAEAITSWFEGTLISSEVTDCKLVSCELLEGWDE